MYDTPDHFAYIGGIALSQQRFITAILSAVACAVATAFILANTSFSWTAPATLLLPIYTYTAVRHSIPFLSLPNLNRIDRWFSFQRWPSPFVESFPLRSRIW